MKRFTVFVAVMLSVCGCDVKKSHDGDVIDCFDVVEIQFKKPHARFGTAPLWVWNNKVDREIIDSSLKDLKDKGFGGVFIHPRPGLISEYLSDEWFEMYKFAVEKGRNLGMYVWIYDENSYPSGFAGGHVPAEMPESYNQGQSLILQKFDKIPDNSSKEWFIILKKDGDRMVDITDSTEVYNNNECIFYAFKKGFHRTAPWYGGYSYVDLLLPGVTQKFIEITMDGYKKHIGNEFGKTVPGWFTDEPDISAPGGGIRFTPDLFDVFYSKWGYNLKENLPSLFEETGDWKRVRHNYFQVLLDLFIDRWAKPCYEYCEENNLIFTGHYWEHDWPTISVGPDNMAMYAWHQQPAIDMLFNNYNDEHPNAQFGNVRSVKELRSVANQLGRRRTLSETYGAGGWDETFRDFKRLGDWEYALGVNFMNQHIANLSIAGARKYDHPPVFSSVEPWWDNYRDLNVYFARLSMALSAGEQINDILIIEPTTSVWLYYAYRNSNKHYYDIGNTFQKFITSLEKSQTEYDLASEDIIKDHGKIDGEKFVIGERAYSYVVIPPMTENLDSITFSLLKEYTANGGTVISCAKPEYIDGQKNEELATFFSGSTNVSYIEEEKALNTIPIIYDKILFNIISGKDLYHQRREIKDGQLIFLANSSLTDVAKGSFSTKGKDALELNAMTGKILDYPETQKDGRLEINYEIPPAGSLLLYISDSKRRGYISQEKVEYTDAVPEISTNIKPLDDNVLVVDFCDLTLGQEKFNDMHIIYASDNTFRYNGFKDGNPWNMSVQYKNNIVSRDTFTTGGFIAEYHFTVTDSFDYTSITAAVERSALYTVKINGNEVKASGKKWLDPEIDIIEIGQHVQCGKNTISLTLSPFKILAEIEQVAIIGNFRVFPDDKGFKIAAPSDFTTENWKSQGYPFYSKSFSYSKKFNITDLNIKYAVELGTWNGTVAEVFVNGVSAGIISFSPYRKDVSTLLQKGENTIDVHVAGSNHNLFGPFHRDGFSGIVSPWDFRNVKKYPAGEKYLQLEYGLTGSFELKSGK
ncbi:MAG: hypothetical protein LBJ17_08940 [Dysgonamonadaceae bacterium]|jgi:hypothetical protein|nr:hypothetical protein [Dysgonamonadaceae bacterium]